MFSNYPKVTKYLSYFWKIICHQERYKNCLIWSHWPLHTYFMVISLIIILCYNKSPHYLLLSYILSMRPQACHSFILARPWLNFSSFFPPPSRPDSLPEFWKKNDLFIIGTKWFNKWPPSHSLSLSLTVSRSFFHKYAAQRTIRD